MRKVSHSKKHPIIMKIIIERHRLDGMDLSDADNSTTGFHRKTVAELKKVLFVDRMSRLIAA
tara:strand:+ start:548 stop:733 length:186 start_codon:yes stop_codon:yes gene_type:complete